VKVFLSYNSDTIDEFYSAARTPLRANIAPGGGDAADFKMTFDSRHIPDHLYFVTANTIGWKPLFSETEYAEIVLNSLSWLRQEKRMSLYAFVLMSTHLHSIVLPLDRSIGNLLQNFGSFTAHKILQKLLEENRKDLIEFFHAHRRDNNLEHSIWQDIQAKNIYSEKFLFQKMEYIHQNPVAKERNLVHDRAEYQYSSACFYDEGRRPVIEIDDIRDFLFLD
jgi:putative transposase